MSKEQGSSPLWAAEACDKFNERTNVTSPHCAQCGWEKMDHQPLTHLQVISDWASGASNLTEGAARIYTQDLLELIAKVQAQTEVWHKEYADALKAEGFGNLTESINDFDDAGHAIDEILSETLDAPIPGTGGMWAIVINGGQMSKHPTRFSAMFSAEAARKRGDHVDVYAEIYPDGKSHWELQAL